MKKFAQIALVNAFLNSPTNYVITYYPGENNKNNILLSENDFNSSEDENIIEITNLILEHFHAMTYLKM
jgi:hypothetical protein